MENTLKITTGDGGVAQVESTHNPGHFDLPNFEQKEGAYYIHFPGEVVASAIAQSNDFDQVLIAQLEYQNNGVVVRFVTLNREVKSSDFTLNLVIKKEERKLGRPAPLSEVLAASIISVGKDRP